MFSVVIPAYRAESTIARAVSSVLAQTLPAAEIIIVADDGKNYAAVLDHLHAPTLRYITTGRIGSGSGGAKNVGIDAAANPYIVFLDADDEFTPTRLEVMKPLVDRYGAAHTATLYKDGLTGVTLPNINASYHDDRLSALQLLTAGLHGLGHLAFDKQRCPTRFLIPQLIDDSVFAASLYDHLDAVGYSSLPLCTYYRHPGSVTNDAISAEKYITIIDETLDARSTTYPILSKYRAFSALKQYLQCVREAEVEYISRRHAAPFQEIYGPLAREKLFPAEAI